jgi:hypothetical protein
VKAVLTLVICLGLLTKVEAQTANPPDESALAAAIRTEGDRIGEDCSKGFAGTAGCAITFVTDHPFHVALGSIAPQNGFGVGGSGGWTWNNVTFPSDFSADAVRAPGGAWRAGAYLTIAHADDRLPQPVRPGEGTPASAFVRTQPVYQLYVHSISRPVVRYYGLGNASARDAGRAFALNQTMFGGNAIVPLSRLTPERMELALVGGLAGRHMKTGDAADDQGPKLSGSEIVSDATGFGRTTTFVEFGGGARARVAVGSRTRLTYEGRYDRYSTSDAALAFGRVTVDLDHRIAIYRGFHAQSTSDTLTPNGCERGSDGQGSCRASVDPLRRPDRSWNKTGTIDFRVRYEQATAGSGDQVPFYLMPTLGGSDINGERLLSSYDDYRFRGPRLFVLQESFEHSVAGPVGVWIELTQGRVGLNDERLTTDLRHSVALGATLRAGAAPMLTIAYAAGGPEGHHLIAVMSTSLLGGGGRPSWR